MDQLEWIWESIRMDARHYQKKKNSDSGFQNSLGNWDHVQLTIKVLGIENVLFISLLMFMIPGLIQNNFPLFPVKNRYSPE